MNHLSVEEFDDALAGKQTAEGASHLLQCERCADEVAQMRALRGNLQQQAEGTAIRVLSQVRRRHGSLSGIAIQARQQPRRSGWRWAATTAAVVAIVVGSAVPLLHHGASPAVPAIAAHQTGAVEPPAMTDEALLTSVQNDLSSSVAEPLLPLTGSAATSFTPTPSSK